MKHLSCICCLFVSLQLNGQQVDTLRLYQAGPKYALSHSYISTLLEDCAASQTDGAYQGAGLTAANNGWAVGTVNRWQTRTSVSYKFSSDLPLLQGGVGDHDSILTSLLLKGEVRLLEITTSYNVNIRVDRAMGSNQPRGWLTVLCETPQTKERVIERYYVSVEALPKALLSKIKVCNHGKPIRLFENINDHLGTFLLSKKEEAPTKALLFADSVFNPSKYEQGLYAFYYQKQFDNGLTPPFPVFGVEVVSLPLALRASPNEIKQAGYTLLEPIFTLPEGDTLQSILWNYGDRTPPSQLLRPYHYYIDTGAIAVSLRVTTKSGCVQSLVQPKALYVHSASAEIFTEASRPISVTYYSATENDIRLSPNPSYGIFHFSAFLPLYEVQLVVQRISDGVTVLERAFAQLQSLDIDLQNQTSGMFLLSLKHSGGQEINYKLIKQ